MSAEQILVVEDESIIALDIQQMLVGLGYDVADVVPTGEEAVERALALHPDLILMDIRLAGYIDGIEAAEQILAELRVPVIYLTAYADQTTLERARGTQPYGYLTKPLDKRDLQIAVEISLYRHMVEQRELDHAHRFQQIVNSVNQGLVLLDPDDRVEVANQRGIEYLRLLAGNATLNTGRRVESVDGRLLRDYLAETGDGLPREVTLSGPDERVFEVRVIPLLDSQGDSVQGDERGHVVSIIDVTQARRQEQIQRQQERLATVGQLAAGVAHDFGNILSTISLSAQIVPELERDLGDRSKRHLKIIGEQVRRAHDLISQILDFSRKSDYERVMVDLVPLYKEWVKLIRQTIPEDILMRLNVPQTPCVVLADPTRMQQVLLNLVINARDAMPGGGSLTIDLELILENEYGVLAELYDLDHKAWVRIRVSDTGKGIEPDDLPHVFDPFFTTKPSGKGNGLGLSQVHGIVQQHGGYVTVTSQPEEGTTFDIIFPCADETVVEVSPESAEHSLSIGGRQTVLLVEDDALIRHALSESIGIIGYHVLEASDGREALARLRAPNSEIALVITDMVMPHIGALGLCRTMHDEAISLPVIVISGYALEKEFEELRALGVRHVLQKPIRLEELSARMAEEFQRLPDTHNEDDTPL